MVLTPNEDEALLEDKTIWKDWEWIEPSYAYELSELSHYKFTRFVGCNVYAVNKWTGEKRWLYFKAYSEIRYVPVKNF